MCPDCQAVAGELESLNLRELIASQRLRRRRSDPWLSGCACLSAALVVQGGLRGALDGGRGSLRKEGCSDDHLTPEAELLHI